jgi:hypothetical protein
MAVQREAQGNIREEDAINEEADDDCTNVSHYLMTPR